MKWTSVGELMSEIVKRVVIVGGGSAGWLTAGVIAAENMANDHNGLEVLLVESPDIKPIGVGEGSWPSMRSTLQKMGVSETDFIRECDASFKQGSKFSKWSTGAGDEYYHPFTLPTGYNEINLATQWQKYRDKVGFADAVCVQSHLCNSGLAPKHITTPEYACVANYGYHLDAGKFTSFLHKHCVEKLGVKYLPANVSGVNVDSEGYIASLITDARGDITGDLFVDCTGFTSLLIGTFYKIPFISKKNVLFNDAAIAVQIPYKTESDPIASHTLSTAQSAGWIWDIGLASRRGVGYVYSSAHITAENAEAELRKYIEPSLDAKLAESISFRKISINSGYRQVFWHKNCVAVGLSAGFLEPLEASALVLVELSAKMISEQMPVNRAMMSVVAKRFNEKFTYRWERIIDFLKLHYILTKRTDSSYWRDNCAISSIPDSLQELVNLWRYQSPWHYDTTHMEEMFPSASFQYVLYGMGFETLPRPTKRRSDMENVAERLFMENAQRIKQLSASLPTNRELLNKIKMFGLQKI
jgi:tryptophan halogenase